MNAPPPPLIQGLSCGGAARDDGQEVLQPHARGRGFQALRKREGLEHLLVLVVLSALVVGVHHGVAPSVVVRPLLMGQALPAKKGERTKEGSVRIRQ